MTDPAKTKLGEMLLDDISPVIMVLCTPLVEESCRKNNLSLIELLAPFCRFNNIDVPVRTSDQPYRLRIFRLRLFSASDIRQRDVQVVKERLKQVVIDAGDKDIDDLCSHPARIESTSTNSVQETVPSWFECFNKELVHAVTFSEHEAIDHPVTCLIAVSSRDKDPVGKFVDLFNTNQLPTLLSSGAMDPNISKFFLLVHDNQEGSPEKANGILTEMRSTFGSNDCRLCCINSSTDGAEEHDNNPWASNIFNISSDQKVGGCLNVDDIEELRRTMHDLASKHIIPQMELKIRVLNQQVAATRKGFRNQIKNLWWRKGKEDALDNLKGSMYTYSSTESQIRVLGDYAFMLQDYELALSNYRLISTDYKLDKAWKHYAGVQEIMGLAYFMLDQSRKDSEYCMENSFSTYLKIGPSGWRNATRCGIWWSEMSKARDQYKDAAAVYFRIPGEEPLHSAVMLEQASYCYLLARPTMLRKYGFHLVLSGDIYKKCDQIKHAIRTYKAALTVFNGTAWSRIRDHIHFHIGKWYASLGLFDEAIRHVLEVIACGHQSKATQEMFLNDSFRIIQETGKTFEVSRLQLPVINSHSTEVVFEDHRTYASATAAGVQESLWRSLEEDMIPSPSTVKTNWLDSQPKVSLKKFKESNVSVAGDMKEVASLGIEYIVSSDGLFIHVFSLQPRSIQKSTSTLFLGEDIKVDVSFRNPLQIPISVSNISLICKHYVEYDKTDSDKEDSLIDSPHDKDLRAVSVSGEFRLDTDQYTLSEADVSMQGGETVLVQLSVIPKTEGTLKILGVRWRLSGSVIAIHHFNSDVMRKKVAKVKRKRKQSVKNSLQFLVIKSLPRLEGVIHNLTETVYCGDVSRLTLELRNPSKLSVKNLKIRVSPPRFVNFSNQESMDLDFPSQFRKKENLSQTSGDLEAIRKANGVFVFPETDAVSWDKPITWPLWFRAATAGKISLYITVYYEMEEEAHVITYRTLRMHYNIEVLPSVEVSFHAGPCPYTLQEFLVRMDVINRTNSERFQIRQLSCVGDQWELAFLRPIDSGFPLKNLMAGQAISCFFKLKSCRTLGTAKDNASSVKIGDDDGDDNSVGFFDMSMQPFVLFHHQERLHQERPKQQGQGDTVDFILLLESQGDSDTELPSTKQVYSHYTCYCSVANSSPIWWLINGPHGVARHDFSTSPCEINFTMTVHNSSEGAVSVQIKTHDFTPTLSANSNSSAAASSNEVGWHDTSHLTDVKVTSDVVTKVKSQMPESVPPFLWSCSSSTQFDVDPLSTVTIPLQVTVFSPGTFDLSNYSLQWNAVSKSLKENEEAPSGTCPGRSFHIKVLQIE